MGESRPSPAFSFDEIAMPSSQGLGKMSDPFVTPLSEEAHDACADCPLSAQARTPNHDLITLEAREIFDRTLGEQVRKDLIESVQMRFIAAGQEVCKAGLVCDSLFLISSGEVVVETPNGGKRISRHRRGAIFWPMFATQSGRICRAQAVAHADAVLLRLPRTRTLALAQKHPELAMRLIDQLSTQLRDALEAVAILSQPSCASRLARYLTQLPALDAEGSNREYEVLLPSSRIELARELGVQPESLSRAIRVMKDEGIVAVTRRRVRVLQAQHLHELI